MFLTAIPGPLTNADSTAAVKAGSRYVDKSGNEYVYALGCSSCAAGSIVALGLETTNNTPTTSLLDETTGVTGAVPIAVALAAVDGSHYGWFQVYGVAEGSVLTLDAADAVQYTSATDGSIDDTSSSQVKLHGIRLVDTNSLGTTANATMWITYPHTKGVAEGA
jgi:hypothetical protein